MSDPHQKLVVLRETIRQLPGAIVCFSGGVDSALVLAIAHEELGNRAIAFTAVSPALPLAEREAAAEFARRIGVTHQMIESEEIHNPAYAANPVNRCFFCKQEIFAIAGRLADEYGAEILNGTNADDLSGHRPGLNAGYAAGVHSPLVTAGMTKEDVRASAKLLGLPLWDKPAFACLSSRFPTGTRITADRLARIERIEDRLRDYGFRIFRARFHNDLLRIETAPEELHRLLSSPIREDLIVLGRAVGFRHVTVDLAGYGADAATSDAILEQQQIDLQKLLQRSPSTDS